MGAQKSDLNREMQGAMDGMNYLDQLRPCASWYANAEGVSTINCMIPFRT